MNLIRALFNNYYLNVFKCKRDDISYLSTSIKFLKDYCLQNYLDISLCLQIKV